MLTCGLVDAQSRCHVAELGRKAMCYKLSFMLPFCIPAMRPFLLSFADTGSRGNRRSLARASV